MTTESGKAIDETLIRALIDDRVRAVRTKDIDGSTSSIAPDILVFDVVGPLQYGGSDAVRKRAEEWVSSFEGPIGFEVHNLSIATGDDVAFSHSLNRVSATKTEERN
jgi:ketosteroid isomerase-like protein